MLNSYRSELLQNFDGEDLKNKKKEQRKKRDDE